ncbi:MAG: carboxypeptidase regulatory-like domain-containing protein [Armatimonadetes bacterium]|nr:carboxypeptidase regulatory-like domain-containing protein [Armatimonadota bacterium]
MKRFMLLLLITAVTGWLLAGCGGGGRREIAISGTVTDIAGNLVPGAEIRLDDRLVTKSLMNGTYKISRLSAGLHNVDASGDVNGELWAGSRWVDVFIDGPTMNMNIIIGPVGDLGTIEGTVTDLSNNPIPDARIIAVARYPQDRAADEASVVSKVEVADSAGHFEMDDLPGSITVGGQTEEIIYDVIASSAGLSGQARGFENQTKTVTVAGGQITRVDFTLESSTDVIPTVPPGWTSSGALDIISYTVPKTITTRAVQSAYDAVKSSISERTRKAVALRRGTGRAAPPGALIENNVIWYSIWNPFFGIDVPSNLAGFTIYRGTTSNLQQTGQFRIDFARDPAIVTYADTSRELTDGVTYWYAVSAVSTSYLDADDLFNPAAESEMSFPVSVTPLGRLQAVSPGDGAFVNTLTPTFSWGQVPGARTYKVFIYDDYPIVDALFTPQGDPQRPDHLPAWGESETVTGTSAVFSDPNFPLVQDHEYWWVVMAADSTDFDFANAYAISELRSFVIR